MRPMVLTISITFRPLRVLRERRRHEMVREDEDIHHFRKHFRSRYTNGRFSLPHPCLMTPSRAVPSV